MVSFGLSLFWQPDVAINCRDFNQQCGSEWFDSGGTFNGWSNGRFMEEWPVSAQSRYEASHFDSIDGFWNSCNELWLKHLSTHRLYHYCRKRPLMEDIMKLLPPHSPNYLSGFMVSQPKTEVSFRSIRMVAMGTTIGNPEGPQTNKNEWITQSFTYRIMMLSLTQNGKEWRFQLKLNGSMQLEEIKTKRHLFGVTNHFLKIRKWLIFGRVIFQIKT